MMLDDVDVSGLSALFVKPGKAVLPMDYTSKAFRSLLNAAFGNGDPQSTHDLAIAAGATCSCGAKAAARLRGQQS